MPLMFVFILHKDSYVIFPTAVNLLDLGAQCACHRCPRECVVPTFMWEGPLYKNEQPISPRKNFHANLICD